MNTVHIAYNANYIFQPTANFDIYISISAVILIRIYEGLVQSPLQKPHKKYIPWSS